MTVQKFYCRECSEVIDFSFGEETNMKMIALSFCFSCLHWHQWDVLKDDPNVARISGKHYFIGSETSWEIEPPKWRGMAGGKVIVKFFSGREVTSTNFWYQGEIPERWRRRLPDNAEFVKQK